METQWCEYATEEERNRERPDKRSTLRQKIKHHVINNMVLERSRQYTTEEEWHFDGEDWTQNNYGTWNTDPSPDSTHIDNELYIS